MPYYRTLRYPISRCYALGATSSHLDIKLESTISRWVRLLEMPNNNFNAIESLLEVNIFRVGSCPSPLPRGRWKLEAHLFC